MEASKHKCGVTDMDLGDDNSFPRDVCPQTADSVEAWVFKSLTIDPSEIADKGVAPAFQKGTVSALVKALDQATQFPLDDDKRQALVFLRDLFAKQMGA
jgi:hypothetical protein